MTHSCRYNLQSIDYRNIFVETICTLNMYSKKIIKTKVKTHYGASDLVVHVLPSSRKRMSGIYVG